MGTSSLPRVLPCMLILFSLSSVVFSQTPTVSVTQAAYSGVPGGSVTLVCSVSSTAAITSAFWYRDRGGSAITITNGGKYSFPIGTNPSLTITSLTNDDTGSYRCFAGTATSQIGQSDLTFLTVSTPNAAPVVQHPQTSYTQDVGGSVTIGCVISANPGATSVVWTKNSATITIDGSKYQNGNTATPSLLIANLVLADAGTFVCGATNAFGSAQTTGATLTVTGSVPVLSTPTTSVTANIGTSITLQCSIQSANPAVTSVTWLFVPSAGGATTNINSATNGYTGSTTANPSLTITSVSSANAGTYTCGAVNAAGPGQGLPITLTVTGSPPIVSVGQSAYSVGIGGVVTLVCNVNSGSSVTSVIWRKLAGTVYQQVLITSNSRYSGGTTTSPSFSITNAQTSDGGTFTCEAFNQFGTTTSSTTVLTVTGNPPTVSIPQPTYATNSGGTVTLTCSISSNPFQTGVTWQKLVGSVFQQVQITGNSRYSGGTTTSPNFVITGALTTDSGTYQCTATNQFGTSQSGTTQLTVSGTAPSVSIPQPTYATNSGGSITLVCNVNSNPFQTGVTWQKLVGSVYQQVQITSNSRYSGGTTTSTNLVITGALTTDSGTYQCTATNQFGTAQSGTTQLTVSGVVPSVSIPQQTYATNSGGSITLVCNVNADPFQTGIAWQILVGTVYQQVQITTNSRYSGGTTTSTNFVITNAQTSDSGTYRCTATNSIGTAQSGTTQLTVSGTAPSVSIPQQTYATNSGGSITLVCNVNANPFQTGVTWHKLVGTAYQQVQITTNSRYSGGTTTSTNLVITGALTTDSGTYQCRATNQFGTSQSGTTQLTVSGVVPSVSIPQQTYATNSGGSITLVCNVNADPFQTGIAWQILVGTVYQQVQITTNSRYSGGTTTSTNFVITNAQTSDSGTYRCTATNSIGTAQSGTTQLTVSGTAPSVSIPQQTYATNSGGSITLVCNVNANPFQTGVTWHKLVGTAYQQVQITTNSRYSGGTTTSTNLVITGALTTDSGTYQCRATNQFGTSQSGTTQLTVSGVVPSVSIPQQTYATNSGGSITLVCNVNADPFQTGIAWQILVGTVYQQVQITTNSRYSGGTTSSTNFVITNAQTSDSGTYRCTATNSIGTAQSGTTQLTVSGTAPSVSIPQQTYATNSGGSITLVCNVNANPFQTGVTWHKLVGTAYQQVQITTNSRYSGGTTTSTNLVITGALTTDSGTYQCRATNQFGTSQSGTTQLTVSGVVPSVSIPQQTYATNSGGSITLVCNVNADPFQTGIAWQILVGTVYQQVQITTTSRYSGGTTSSTNFVITNAQTSDSGTYRCTATNSIGTAQSGTTQLTVSGTAPSVSIPQQTYATNSGGSITLVCNVNANPFQTGVTWHKLVGTAYQQVQITTNSRYSGGTTTSTNLVITGALTTDSGTYQCRATNQFGTSQSGTTQLTVSGVVPSVSIPQQTYATNSGGSITLVCNVNADPFQTGVTWQKLVGTVYQQVQITTNSRYSGGTASSTNFAITNAQTSDSGTYRCTATNSIGTAQSGTTQLTVSGSAPSVSIPQQTYATNSGGSITLVCNVNADPFQTGVTWHKLVGTAYQQVQITTNSRYSGGTTTSTNLVITGALTTDSGTYQCRATNQFGTSQSGTTQLTVSGVVPSVSIPQQTYATNSGGSITLVCNVNADPFQTGVTWHKLVGSVYQQVQITTNSRYSGGTTTSTNLVITGALTTDSGTYQCRATNQFGTGQSGTTQLTVSGILPSVSIPESSYSVTASGTIQLVCNVNADPIQTSVAWQKLVNSVFQQVQVNNNNRYTGGTPTTPSFTITNAALSDGGTYRCTATNQVGTGQSGTTQLTVSGSVPSVSIPQPSYTVTLGGSVTIPCNIIANPSVTSVSWQKITNNVPQTVAITSLARYSGGSTTIPGLTITGVLTSDAGFYRCSATNTLNTGTSGQTQLIVTSAPTVSIPSPTYTATTGTAVTLVCNIINANPTQTSVRWDKLVSNAFQQVAITTNSRYNGGTPSSPSLAITNSQPGDSGTYRCSATNTVGTGTSGTTQLTVSGSFPSVSIPQPTYTATTGAAVTLVCNVNANPTQTSVNWEKLVNNAYQQVAITTNSRYGGGTAGSPSLVITNSQPGDSGTYKCSATNAVGTGMSGTTQLTVSGSIPSVSIPQPTYTATTGAAVTLVCNVNANPTQTSVNWEKLVNNAYQQVAITTNNRYGGGTAGSPSLVITNSQPGDSGTYKCSATNAVGTGMSGTTQLTVSGSIPSVSIPQPTYTATTGAAVTLVCNVNANPTQTSVNWEKLVNNAYQQVAITTNSRYGGGTAGSPSLVITNSQPGDSATYKCSATNAVGTGMSGTTQLTVSGSIPTVTIPQTVYTATTSSTVMLTCTVNASPFQTSVGWDRLVNGIYQDAGISSNNRYSGGTTNNPTLTITNSQPSDSGTYRCKATNQVGTGFSVTTQLTVSGNVPVVNIPQPTYTVVIGSSIAIPCSVTSNPTHSTVTWQRIANGQVTTLDIPNSGGKYSVGPITAPTLTISNAQSGDAGPYNCIAVNTVGSGQDSATLAVSGAIPSVTIPQSGYSVQTGSSITIPCNIVATPSITAVQWEKVQGTTSTPLTINNVDYSGGSTTTPALTIPSASRSTHAGFYVCTATNAVGLGTSATVVLSVTGNVPSVSVQQTPATAITGTSTTLQCFVNADPVATIVQWERVASNGVATAINVAGNSKYTGASTSNPSLTITTTVASDSGIYRCTATNAIGKGTSGQVTLTVTGNPPTVSVTQTSYTVTTGSAVTLQCSASGVPAVTSVSWERLANGQTTQIPLSSGQFSIGNPSLVINSAGSADAGTYTCKAANIVGAAQSSPVTLAVTGAPPTVQIGSTVYTAITGSSTTLACTVTATPSATLVRWTKQTTTGTVQITTDGTKYSGSTPSSPSLIINSVSSTDEGTYVCQATNVVGTASSAQTTLSVIGSVPNVQVAQPSYSVTKGGTITLACTVTGIPAATSVAWKRTSGGTETVVSTATTKYSGSTIATPSLTITGAASEDAATYVCTATNSVGEGRSTQTSLSVTGDIPTVTVPDPTYSIISGNSITLRCIVSATPPVNSIQWKKIKNAVTTNIDVSLAAYTGGTTGSPSLTIVTASAADTAEYICTATNSVGTAQSGRTSLTVTGAVPTVNIPVSAYSVVTGQSITIVCNVVANPGASAISWSKTVGTVTSVLNIDNNKFTGGNIQTPSLTITNAGANDAASYTCKATNVVGSGSSNAAVLTVTGGLPTVTIQNPAITAVVGSSVTFTCKVTANPQATQVSWKRTIGGVTTTLTTSTKFTGSTVTNPSLTINNLATADQGSYVCTATNQVGVGESSPGTLTVTGSVPSVVISKPSYTVVIGQDVTIDCDFTASPDATSIKWRKIVNDQPSDLTLTGNVKYSGGTLTSPSLVVRTTVATDQAFYQCVVTNSVGSGESTTAYLFVTGAPPTATVTQTTYNINLGDPVTITCNVAGVPDVTSVSWTITKPPSTVASPITIAAPKYSGGSLTTPSLTISSTTLTDQGTYACKATNSLGTGTSSNVFLTVVGSSPTVSVPVSAYAVDLGGEVVLLCNIVANPTVTSVYWTRTVSGAVNQITAAAPKYSGSVPTNPSLTIKNLISSDEGSYRCHASNSVGSGQSELTSLVVSVAPTNIVVNPATVTRREQQSFSSTCSAEANPAPTYKWVKKSTQQVVSTVQTLSVQNVDRGHIGEYVCTATNARGSASATLTVNIQYKPISTVTNEEQTMVIGMNDPRTLTCNTIANPAVETYRWTKGNTNIAGATGLTYVVTVASNSDYGAYSCYATNSIGESSAITFNLRSGAVTTTLAPTAAPALTTETIIAIAVAIAVLLLILIIICVCCMARTNAKPKVTKVYTRKPTPAPMTMVSPPPMMMSDPSMAIVPMGNSMRPYDNYHLGRSGLPAHEYTFYESEQAKDRSSFIEG
ncbi:hemicentin-1-like isoform X2 [Pecten maximus]|uniref:hemicentin-1-like isoform X2 n=1 Tax=Pecten maximus TaxID=6579 RepID=UPI0014583841|nr:hemicentin-1-like isoform X2 [Pecten maximus]